VKAGELEGVVEQICQCATDNLTVDLNDKRLLNGTDGELETSGLRLDCRSDLDLCDEPGKRDPVATFGHPRRQPDFDHRAIDERP
jgi:hypothetical protein